MGRCTEGCCLLPAERLCTHGPSATGRSHSTHLNRNVYSLNLLSGPQSCPPARGTLRARRKNCSYSSVAFLTTVGKLAHEPCGRQRTAPSPVPPHPTACPAGGLSLCAPSLLLRGRGQGSGRSGGGEGGQPPGLLGRVRSRSPELG